jgi:UDP-3-O-[3-hydroxymyristoyl] glucosamine N-acyltransferase
MMSVSLKELASLVGGQVCGDGELQLSGAATIRDAKAGEITLADSPQLAKQLAGCAASAVVVPGGFQPQGIDCLVVDHVHGAFARIVAHFRPPRPARRVGISPGAHISSSARLGSGVDIHAAATIGDDVEIGDGAVVHAGVRIMAGCRIGKQVVLFPNVVLYENTVIGDQSIVHAGAVIGAYGFGYEPIAGRHQLSSQLGWVEIGAQVEIGAGSTIDRGTYGPTIVGEGTKVDNQVQIGHNCRIGRHNILCSQVGIAGSCTTGDYVMMAGQVGLADHLTIGDRAQLGAQAGVMRNIPSDAVHTGSPSFPMRDYMMQIAALARLPEMRKQVRNLQRAVAQIVGEVRPRDEQEAA